MPPGRRQRSAFSKRYLEAERFDRHIGAAARELLDFSDDIALLRDRARRARPFVSTFPFERDRLPHR